ncbi:AAA family ATPase [Colletotrichum kahawae]|uniref:AAA family ATPase n=1 Tax=Colletotrichum kahawae TaxID=34407 RepID=A0AAE0D0K3_COLKA|nr:AAA family ATPase [Colletotrichum kahawae]
MDIAKGLVNINLHQDPIIIPSPYVEIYYCERRIQEALDVAMDKSLCDQLRLLQKFREDYMARTVNDLHALEPSGLITFDLLSFIFAPGHPVVLTNRYLSHFPTHWTALLHSCHFIQDGRDDKNLELELRLKYTGFNGTVFGSVNTTITLDRFIGTKNITELPVYPIKYHPDHHNLLESLKVRGLEYSRLCLGGAKAPVAQKTFGSHVHYSGPVWELPPHDETRRQQSASWSSRSSFSSITSPNLSSATRVVEEFTGIPFDELTEMDLASFPPIIPGFTLTKRLWGFFLVSHVGQIDWNEEAFNSLHLESQRKDAVWRLVREHRLGTSMFDDVVAGKGRGLVFLLHGPPGSGKTMTAAEVVAESLQCPVYYTSGGELGLDMWEIESNLRLIFKRMQRWGAVLLFDEADTFMAQRSEDNIERNALVSILLRMLEYQSGILFLTTNRIDDFDTAFFSRIHVRLEFDKPGAPQRTLIWSYLAEKDGHAISQEEFAKLGNLPMDGRRIKNVLRVASLLCRSRDAAGKTTVDDVKKSLRISAGDPNDEGVEQAIQDFCG